MTHTAAEEAQERPRRRRSDLDETRPKVLLVDDEPAVLDGLELQLRRHVNTTTALGPKQGMSAMKEKGPFQVVVSDMRMPGMDGATFLSHVREMDADAVRMMLTGNTDIETALAAVNEGSVFRILLKPCPPHVLLQSIEAAIEQHRLLTSERVLLSQTLGGCVRALTGVLAIARPKAMSRALRARQRVAALAAQSGEEAWSVELAAMLSQVPAVAIPEELETRYFSGEAMDDAERARVERVPVIAGDLVAGIPRLEHVRAILQHLRNPSASDAPWGARALAAALDLDALAQSKADARTVLARLAERGHDPRIVEPLADLWLQERKPEEPLLLPVADLKPGMVLAGDVLARNGALMATAGHELTTSLLQHVLAVAKNSGVAEPILVQPTKRDGGLWD